mmetsp:Transcript_116335/g.276517  ORF Transcript_116335/g.276517 Transcript_116335/m.276517 type:complete len:207 (-) Transcript_116335:2106-2726(-)
MHEQSSSRRSSNKQSKQRRREKLRQKKKQRNKRRKMPKQPRKVERSQTIQEVSKLRMTREGEPVQIPLWPKSRSTCTSRSSLLQTAAAGCRSTCCNRCQRTTAGTSTSSSRLARVTRRTSSMVSRRSAAASGKFLASCRLRRRFQSRLWKRSRIRTPYSRSRIARLQLKSGSRRKRKKQGKKQRPKRRSACDSSERTMLASVHWCR